MDAKTLAQQISQADQIGGRACNCMGPRPGEPLCPCAMRGVIIRDGRYVLPERDLGPVPKSSGLAPDRNSASGFRLTGPQDWMLT